MLATIPDLRYRATPIASGTLAPGPTCSLPKVVDPTDCFKAVSRPATNQCQFGGAGQLDVATNTFVACFSPVVTILGRIGLDITGTPRAAKAPSREADWTRPEEKIRRFFCLRVATTPRPSQRKVLVALASAASAPPRQLPRPIREMEASGFGRRQAVGDAARMPKAQADYERSAPMLPRHAP